MSHVIKRSLCVFALAAIIFLVLRGFYFHPVPMIIGACVLLLIVVMAGINTSPSRDIYDNDDEYECQRPTTETNWTDIERH